MKIRYASDKFGGIVQKQEFFFDVFDAKTDIIGTK